MSTRDMIKKKRRSPISTESSSSVKTVRSKPPKNVLGLGRHLVRELNLDDGIDTLAKWMAHHVAELIKDAETAPSGEKRSRASKRATETILKIWEHRELLPSYAYPLARYNEVLR